MSNHSIIQSFFEPSQKQELLAIWGEDDASRIQSYPYHFSVYSETNNPIPFVKISSFQDFSIDDFPDFNLLLHQLPVKQLPAMIFLCTLFPHKEFIAQFQSQKFQHNNQVTSSIGWQHYLNGSFGYLIYTWQLEFFYCMLTGKSYAEAIGFRKDWNLKRAIVRYEAKEIMINKELSFYDLIHELNPHPGAFVFQPVFKEGYQLWKYCGEG